MTAPVAETPVAGRLGASGTGMSSPAAAGGSPSTAQAGAAGSRAGAGGSGAGSRAGTGAAVGGSMAAGTGAEVSAGAPSMAPPKPDDSVEIYDPAKLPRFDIELPPESVRALEAVTGPDDPRQEEWVHASVRYGAELVTDVGIRIKGEGSFRTLDEKPPFKIKFDEFVPDQQLRGLKRLTLNNMVEDPSFLAERLAYEVFRAAKLPAPRCNSALVYVNGAFYGVYANVEAVDKTFLRRWFASDGGNLYEEGQHDFVPGAETTFDLETNETTNDRSDLQRLIAALDKASESTLLSELDPHLDVAHYLRFTAAEAAVNQWDMYSYTVFYPNNFRFYADPSTSKFVFLPWGMDMSMKPYRDSGRPHVPVFGIARQYDQRNSAVSAGLIFRKCVASADCKARYAAVVAEVAEVYEGLGLEAVAARYYEQIREHVAADSRTPYSPTEFESGYRTLLKTIRERPAALRADLAAP
jgi:hypothetical protein